MSWTAPRTWVAGEVLTASLLNTHVRDNLVASPRGVLPSGYAQKTVDQGTITAEVDITSLTVTVTVEASRLIRVTVVGGASSDIAGGIGVLIKEGATALQTHHIPDLLAGNLVRGFQTSVLLTPSAGSHTYKVAASRLGGSEVVAFSAAATRPAHILVEDLGLA